MSDSNRDGDGSTGDGAEFEPMPLILITDVTTAHRLIDENPIRPYRKENDQLRKKNKWDKSVDSLPERHSLALNATEEWLVSVQKLQGCFDKYHGRFNDCQCLVDVEVASLSKMLVEFAENKKEMRDTITKLRIDAAEERMKRRNDLLKKRKLEELPKEISQPPYILDLGMADTNPRVCLVTFRNVFGYFKDEWKTLKADAKAGNVGPLPQKNIGNSNRTKNSSLGKCETDLHLYLKNLGELYGESYATRFIRERTSIGLRDAEIGKVELPSNMGKRKIYESFCHSRGFIMKPNAKGAYPSLKECPLRPNDELGWPVGSECLPICCWSSFHIFWEKNFPLMDIRKPSKDTCGECVIHKNKVKYALRSNNKTNQIPDDELADEDSALSSDSVFCVTDFVCPPSLDDQSHSSAMDQAEIVMDQEAIAQSTEASVMEAAPEIQGFGEDEEYLVELLYRKADDHVVQAAIQRVFAQRRAQEAIDDRSKEHEERTHCLIMDYAQNLGIPYFGGEQPGAIYYFSPLAIYILGICDVSTLPNKMLAYAYSEGDGNKGANNVASLLIHALRHLGILIEGRTGLRLTVVMDNCSGQNKNNTVLRLALWLVEMHYFKEVCFTFYIRGHTKNACDRLFNQMKHNFHKSQVFTMQELMARLNEQPHVTAIQASPSLFFNYNEMIETFYTKLSGKVTSNHIFTVKASDPTTMILKSDNDSEECMLNCKKKGNGTDEIRSEEMKSFILSPLDPPGIKEIKQVELYKKWRPYLPQYAKEITCPKPDNALLLRHKDSVKVKRNAKAAAKKSKKSTAAATSILTLVLFVLLFFKVL